MLALLDWPAARTRGAILALTRAIVEATVVAIGALCAVQGLGTDVFRLNCSVPVGVVSPAVPRVNR